MLQTISFYITKGIQKLRVHLIISIVNKIVNDFFFLLYDKFYQQFCCFR